MNESAATEPVIRVVASGCRAELEGATVGSLRFEQVSADQVQVLNVTVEREHRRQGIGGALVAAAVEAILEQHPRTAITAAVEIDNLPAIALLASNQLYPRRIVRDYAGEGGDRLYCRRDATSHTAVGPDDRQLVPASARDHLASLLDNEDHAITALRETTSGPMFEVSTIALEDEHSLNIDEASVGVSEAGAIAAGLTFLLGLSFTVETYSEPLRVLLLFATILTLGSLQAFASATARRARAREESFSTHMRWGNALLEFGGLYPLVIVLPSVFDQASPNQLVSLVVSILVTVAIAVYEYSPFSLTSQQPRSVIDHALGILTLLLPLAAIPLHAVTGSFTLWSALVGLVMVARMVAYRPEGPTVRARRGRVRAR